MVTVAASRNPGFSLSGMEVLAGAVVLAVIAWMVLSRIRRDRHEPHA